MEFNELLKAISESDKLDITFDTKHRLVIRSKEPVDYPVPQLFNLNPFQNVDFISIDKVDADNLIDMIEEAIEFKKSGTRVDDDVEVFGERAISYERLLDYMDLIVYEPPVVEVEEREIKAEDVIL